MSATALTRLVFLSREVSVGRGSTNTLGGGAMPKIHSVEAWDGKDGQVSEPCHCGLMGGEED